MNEFDIVIIGGGAAGLSAALVLTRARRRVAVIYGLMPRLHRVRTCLLARRTIA